jgi:hypothetical protein
MREMVPYFSRRPACVTPAKDTKARVQGRVQTLNNLLALTTAGASFFNALFALPTSPLAYRRARRGHKGARSIHPSRAGSGVGFAPFPVERA